MKIGVPREIKSGEQRVGLTPEAVDSLSSLGHELLIEQGAGTGSGYGDEDFRSAGATVVEAAADVWGRAELVIKVKEPLHEEFKYFRPELGLFCFLHPAALPEMTLALLHSKVTALDYDLLATDDGKLPLLEPMSVIAGKLAVQCGAHALQTGSLLHAPSQKASSGGKEAPPTGGRGVLLGGCAGVPPARIVVIGAGAAGSNAARLAIDMGAEVTVIDRTSARLQPFTEGRYRTRTLYSSPSSILHAIKEADLVIGAVLVPGAKAPLLLTRAMVAQMKPGSVIVDICIDQGGFSETSRPTSIPDPIYLDEGVLHYCVTNMPALVPRTSTEALVAVSTKYVEELARYGILGASQRNTALYRSVLCYNGILSHEVVATALGLPYTELPK